MDVSPCLAKENGLKLDAPHQCYVNLFFAGIPDSNHVLRWRDHQQEAAVSYAEMGCR